MQALHAELTAATEAAKFKDEKHSGYKLQDIELEQADLSASVGLLNGKTQL